MRILIVIQVIANFVMLRFLAGFVAIQCILNRCPITKQPQDYAIKLNSAVFNIEIIETDFLSHGLFLLFSSYLVAFQTTR